MMLVALCACEGSTDGRQPRQVVSFVTRDISTGLTALKVELDVGGTPAPGEPVIAGDSLRLATWPDLAPVPATVASTPMSSPQRLTISATGPSAEGWYIAILDGQKVPATTQFPDPSRHHALANGDRGARVHLGSRPLLWGFQVCQKEAETAVYVSFSEPVLADGAAGAPVSVAVGGIRCAPQDAPSAVAAAMLGFQCRVPDPGDLFVVTVAAGLTSSTGAPLAPSEQSGKWDDLPTGQTLCRYSKREP